MEDLVCSLNEWDRDKKALFPCFGYCLCAFYVDNLTRPKGLITFEVTCLVTCG